MVWSLRLGVKELGKENAGYIGKKTIGTYVAKKGDVILHQIAKDPDVKTNASEILQEFFRYIEADVVLSVRTDNTRVFTSFYKKNGMKRVGNINWGKDGYMKGDVWFYENPTKEYLNSINHEKKNIMDENPLCENQYPAWVVNHALYKSTRYFTSCE